METNSIKVLLADSEPLPEMEDEYDGNDELIDNAEQMSSFLDLVSAIGTEEFEFIYFNLISDIRKYPIENQILLCTKIIDKIKEVYGFEFIQKIYLETHEDVENVYKFIEFLEFDYIDFIVDLLTGIVNDIRKEPIRAIIEENWMEIESRILKQNLSRLIFLFLRTNNKEDLVDFLVSKATNNKSLITTKLFERSIVNDNSNN
jgi:hypothetical protein